MCVWVLCVWATAAGALVTRVSAGTATQARPPIAAPGETPCSTATLAPADDANGVLIGAGAVEFEPCGTEPEPEEEDFESAATARLVFAPAAPAAAARALLAKAGILAESTSRRARLPRGPPVARD